MTVADQLRKISMGWVWLFVFFIVAVCLGITPWEAIEHILRNQGPGDEGTQFLAFVFGYTLPLSVSFGLIAFFVLTGLNEKYSVEIQLGSAGVILFLAGVASQTFGLGLPPSDVGTRISGPWFVAIPVYALSTYFNSYGFGLMISALALGVATALQVERWMHSALSPGSEALIR